MIRQLIPASIRKAISARMTSPGFASYSQSGEDTIISFFLNTTGLTQANYIDIGSSHPIYGNNTYLLYRRGLRGICVDPTPQLPALYRKYRPEDRFIAAAMVPGDDESVTMHFFEESTINTISQNHAALYTGFGYGEQDAAVVPALSLSKLCQEYDVEAPDVLCLDAEGVDFEILSSIDFVRSRPKLICVEVVRYLADKQPVVDERFSEFLLAYGYRKYADTFINQVFVDEAIGAKQRFL